MKLEDLKTRMEDSRRVWEEVKKRWQELGLPGTTVAPHDALLTLLIARLNLSPPALAETLLSALPRLKELRRDPHLAASFIGTGGSAMLFAAILPEETWQEFLKLLKEPNVSASAEKPQAKAARFAGVIELLCANCQNVIPKESEAHRCKLCHSAFCFSCAVSLVTPDYVCTACLKDANRPVLARPPDPHPHRHDHPEDENTGDFYTRWPGVKQFEQAIAETLQETGQEADEKQEFSCGGCAEIFPCERAAYCPDCDKKFCPRCLDEASVNHCLFEDEAVDLDM